MSNSRNIPITRTSEAVRVILSGPGFVIPRIFPLIKKLEVSGKSFSDMARYTFSTTKSREVYLFLQGSNISVYLVPQ
ncbi:STK_08120 family protein [Metallosphaera sedula]|uniref:STK_08120 family protein n=1 Tax=Metallosphaera sedula TaxID=43687 RepID=UPI0035A83A90